MPTSTLSEATRRLYSLALLLLALSSGCTSGTVEPAGQRFTDSGSPIVGSDSGNIDALDGSNPVLPGAGEGGTAAGGGQDGAAPGGPNADAGSDAGAGFEIDPASLRAHVSAALPFIGAAVNIDALRDDPKYGPTLGREFNAVVAENAMKWGAVHPQADTWSFEAPDALVAFARAHAQSVHGHTLIWHQGMPAYVSDALSAEQLRSAMSAHISTLVGRYRGKLVAWDVVNEAIDDTAKLRDSVFARKLGEAYIGEAFQLAKAADGAAELFYNDYGIEIQNAKSDAVYALMKRLVDAGVPIDGIGMQFHVAAYDFASFELTEQKIRANIQRFAALGLKVHVSELDVRLAELPGNAAQKLAYQGVIYRFTTEICRSEPSCEAVRTWGFVDKYSWVDDFYGEDDPLLMDDSYALKPAYQGVLAGLQGIASGSLDYGIDTACGRTVTNAVSCESFEATKLHRSWFDVVSSGSVGQSSSRAAKGKQALSATISASAKSQAFIGRTVLPKVNSGAVYVRASLYVPSSAVVNGQTLNLFGLSEGPEPYQGVMMALSGRTVQLSATTADKYPGSGAYQFPVDSWQCVLLTVQVADSGGSASIRVGNQTVVSASNLDTRPAAGFQNVQAGIIYATPQHPAAQVFVDELITSRSALSCP